MSPLGVEPSGADESLEGGEERSGVHLEDAARDLFDASRDAVSVHRLEAQRFEDEHVERALNDVGVGRVHETTMTIFLLIVKI